MGPPEAHPQFGHFFPAAPWDKTLEDILVLAVDGKM